MAERLQRSEMLSRRAFLAGLIGAVATKKTGDLLSRAGISGYPLEVRTKPAGRSAEDSFEAETGHIITLASDGTLLIEPDGIFFVPGREFEYSHRGGNTFQSIEEAFAMGATLFDIDANAIGGGVYGEHGIVPQLEVGIGKRRIALRLPAVIDVNEKELKLGMPSAYRELIAYIADLSTPERPLAVSVELKRGRFDLAAIESMLAVHRECGLPAILHSQNSEWLASVGGELAATYNVVQ